MTGWLSTWHQQFERNCGGRHLQAVRRYVCYPEGETSDVPNAAEVSRQLFDVTCKGCTRRLIRVDRIRDPEIAVLNEHLKTCWQPEPFRNDPPLGEIMSRVHVVFADGL